MGKPVYGAAGVDSDGDEGDGGKRKRKQELEEIRRNALAVKRNLRSRATTRKAKNGLEKALNKFAGKRRDIENVNQSQQPLLNRKTRTTVITDENISISPKPLRLEGFFRGGIKGKELTRPLRPDEKLRQAILNSDALQLLQSGGLSRRYANVCEDAPTKDVIDSQTRVKISQVLNGSLQSNSDLDNSTSSSNIFPHSPILGGFRGFRKKHPEKSDQNFDSSIILFQNKKAEAVQHTTKGDSCEKFLFERENSEVHTRNTQQFSENIRPSSNGLSRTTTPENEIFFASYTPVQDRDKKASEKVRNKINVSDPKLMNFYMKSCKIIDRKNFNEDFWVNAEDPLKAVKSSLKATYMNNYKDFVHRQQNLRVQRSASSDRLSCSSNSEIMQEPDSVVARALKKNKVIEAIPGTRKTIDNKSDSLSNVSSSRRSILVPKDQEIHDAKKRFSASTHAESGGRTSSSAVVNEANNEPESASSYSKMKDIHPDRHEVIANFLRDVATTYEHKEELNILCSQREEGKRMENGITDRQAAILPGKAHKDSSSIQKGMKHVPAILRKNRPLADCAAKGKVLFSIEKCSKTNVTDNSLLIDLRGNEDFITERTPNSGCAHNESVEAPKCKNVYMNAKYNPPPTWINMAAPQHKKLFRNPEPERQRLLFTSPRIVKRNVVITQSFEASPHRQLSQVSASDVDSFRWQLSQGSLDQGGCCMNRMVSFGDIQEKTNRLTLQSSQGQSCSQEMNEQMPPPQQLKYQSNQYYQHYPSPMNNHAAFSHQKRVVYKDVPSSNSRPVILNLDHQYQPSGTIEQSNQQPSRPAGNNYQLVPSQNFSVSDSEDFDYCKANGIPICGSQSSQKPYPESYMACVPVQQQSAMQPVKFLGVEGNRVPQRRPIYNSNDMSSYTYVHKTTMANQPSRVRQVTVTRQPPPQQVLYPGDTSCNPQYTMSSIRWQNQGAPQCSVPSRYDHHNVNKSSSIAVSNDQDALPIHRNRASDLNRNTTLNFVGNCNTDQTLIGHHSIPVHNLVSNQKYMRQHVQNQIPQSVYPQIEYQHEYCNNNVVSVEYL
ncbi:hypothetical protein QAD02_023018 [Eretmocerus hayati]|uniref:Uncharacterized protein n=1 Tax=Eretmocerus hayati TaxID=131215 RepID=A0ACC2PVA7_9HYME|nr:hypothetical protein QAD02_023018 [Eretmocerus hayati]